MVSDQADDYKKKSKLVKIKVNWLFRATVVQIVQVVQRVPEAATTIFLLVLPEVVPYDSICLTTSMPSTTPPNTTCLPSSHGHGTVVKKNCDPLVPGPALAIESWPAWVCLSVKFSSSNLLP